MFFQCFKIDIERYVDKGQAYNFQFILLHSLVTLLKVTGRLARTKRECLFFLWCSFDIFDKVLFVFCHTNSVMYHCGCSRVYNLVLPSRHNARFVSFFFS